ncbi:hypothetical protein TVAG_092530 [Trichomonas vaginalis G3]|uniref:Uncharacterized protein n=1 Tax=Trichomonas vaginalis (strain ATCC PRA-98 / G3) TaxID=412133 RepID=A2F7C9_TRIV3|nr:hypothetical protein TVAGG3_0961840 [Trichomonas vaginalis G3]EAX99197.1 hypothetical protein TVAG_092530 [Trichomonas vaginalis G3]KAI5487964.1 hypothetical protein TVAGG3_0961840 [Trichomonas vaginalis G3]|eukprot:XP_001312127.1 hypothetical protein [Trichomonas vaginalis G3]
MHISNDFDLNLKFPLSERPFYIIFESAVESTITFFDEDGDGFNFTEETGTLFFLKGKHAGIFSWKNLTELPPNTTKQIVTGVYLPSIYDTGFEILMEGDLKTVRYENKSLKYYAMISRDDQYSVYGFTNHFYLSTKKEGHFFTFNSSVSPCDIVILAKGIPGGLFNPQKYGAEINYFRSDFPGYYIDSKWHNISIIYSYYPFSTTVKHNVSEIKLRLQTNNGPERNVTVQEGETYSIESINRMIIYHPNAYVEFSQIKFDDPNVNYFEGDYRKAGQSSGAWHFIPIRTPQQTTIVPPRTPETSSSK